MEAVYNRIYSLRFNEEDDAEDYEDLAMAESNALVFLYKNKRRAFGFLQSQREVLRHFDKKLSGEVKIPGITKKSELFEFLLEYFELYYVVGFPIQCFYIIEMIATFDSCAMLCLRDKVKFDDNVPKSWTFEEAVKWLSKKNEDLLNRFFGCIVPDNKEQLIQLLKQEDSDDFRQMLSARCEEKIFLSKTYLYRDLILAIIGMRKIVGLRGVPSKNQYAAIDRCEKRFNKIIGEESLDSSYNDGFSTNNSDYNLMTEIVNKYGTDAQKVLFMIENVFIGSFNFYEDHSYTEKSFARHAHCVFKLSPYYEDYMLHVHYLYEWKRKVDSEMGNCPLLLIQKILLYYDLKEDWEKLIKLTSLLNWSEVNKERIFEKLEVDNSNNTLRVSVLKQCQIKELYDGLLGTFVNVDTEFEYFCYAISGKRISNNIDDCEKIVWEKSLRSLVFMCEILLQDNHKDKWQRVSQTFVINGKDNLSPESCNATRTRLYQDGRLIKPLQKNDKELFRLNTILENVMRVG